MIINLLNINDQRLGNLHGNRYLNKLAHHLSLSE